MVSGVKDAVLQRHTNLKGQTALVTGTRLQSDLTVPLHGHGAGNLGEVEFWMFALGVWNFAVQITNPSCCKSNVQKITLMLSVVLEVASLVKDSKSTVSLCFHALSHPLYPCCCQWVILWEYHMRTWLDYMHTASQRLAIAMICDHVTLLCADDNAAMLWFLKRRNLMELT